MSSIFLFCVTSVCRCISNSSLNSDCTQKIIPIILFYLINVFMHFYLTNPNMFMLNICYIQTLTEFAMSFNSLE